MTALEIIEQALSKIGRFAAGQSVSSEDAALCLTALNGIVDAWSLENLTAHALVKLEVPLTAGADEVTLSPRQVRIEGGYTRVGTIDYPLRLVSREEFDQIAVKDLDSIAPEFALYEPEQAAGALFLCPQAQEACTMYLTIQERIDEFADLSTEYSLPQGYSRALVYTLAVEVAPDFRTEAHATVHRQAINSVKALKRARVKVPMLETFPHRRDYNIEAGF